MAGTDGGYEKLLDEGERADPGSVIQQNITGGTAVGDLVASTLGPRGMDKLIYRRSDHEEGGLERFFEVTNSGAYVLRRVKFASPAAGVVAKAAAAQQDRFGDGTTTTAVLASEFLRSVEPLVERGVHPRTVIDGIAVATERATDTLADIAVSVGPDDRDLLEAVARTTIHGRTTEPIVDDLSGWVVDATLRVAEGSGGERSVDPDLVQTESLRSGSIQRTDLIDGMVIKRSFAGHYRPTVIDSPRIAVVTQPFARAESVRHRLEGDEPNAGEAQTVAFRPDDADSYAALQEYEIEGVAALVEPLVDAEVDVVLVGDRVEDAMLPTFDREGIAVVRDARKGRMRKVARATGATINTNLREFDPDDVGRAERVQHREYKGVEQDVLIFEGCAEHNVASVLAHGSTWMSGWEVERNVRNAVCAVGTALEHGAVIPGGGAVEVEVARDLRQYAPAYGGRESLVIEAIADAIEVVPKHLARNAGMEPIDTLLDLRTEHREGNRAWGVLGMERTTGDVFEHEIVDPAVSKEHAIQSAASVSTVILRIDDVVTGIGVGE